jgi:hypothetical protein
MKKLLIALFVAVLMSGCAVVKDVAVCNSTTPALLAQENARLLESRKRIEEHDAGKPFDYMTFSSLTHPEMVSAYKQSYNRAVDKLEYQTAQYERMCNK